jgi:hypothetical protein
VPGIDQDAFAAAAAAAGEGCPISGALKGNVEISVDATLEGLGGAPAWAPRRLRRARSELHHRG